MTDSPAVNSSPYEPAAQDEDFRELTRRVQAAAHAAPHRAST